MATHLDDDEDLENIKRWFRENGLALVAGLVIGLGAIGGWEGWKHYRDGRADEAARLGSDLRTALTAERLDEARAIAAQLTERHAGSPYAALGQLQWAQRAVNDGDYGAAASSLAWVAANAHDPGMRELARVRQARVLWQQQQPDAALALLGQPGAYLALAEELRGDIARGQGDRAGARAAYARALAASEESAPTRDLLQQKLADVASGAAPDDAVASPAAAPRERS